MPREEDNLNDPRMQAWYKSALKECIKRLEELGELSFDDEETACYFWKATGDMLGRKGKP